MGYTGTQANADLKKARDSLDLYMQQTKMEPTDHDTLSDRIAEIDEKRNAIAMKDVLDSLDPSGKLFIDITQATADTKRRVDALLRVQRTVAKALALAAAVLDLAGALKDMSFKSCTAAVTKIYDELNPGGRRNDQH